MGVIPDPPLSFCPSLLSSARAWTKGPCKPCGRAENNGKLWAFFAQVPRKTSFGNRNLLCHSSVVTDCLVPPECVTSCQSYPSTPSTTASPVGEHTTQCLFFSRSITALGLLALAIFFSSLQPPISSPPLSRYQVCTVSLCTVIKLLSGEEQRFWSGGWDSVLSHATSVLCAHLAIYTQPLHRGRREVIISHDPSENYLKKKKTHRSANYY